MTEQNLPTPPRNEGRGPDLAREIDLLLVAYGLYFIGLVTAGIGGLVGVVIAYMKRDEVAGTWRESHYIWLIRTFWIGFLYAVIAGMTMMIGIGVLLGFATVVWLIIRLVKGWIAYSKEAPLTNVESWLVG